MALSIKQLNADASFLLALEPISGSAISLGGPEPFRILLDPWITGPSTIFHPIFSVTSHKEEACISSLRDIPEPDLIIISQHKSDHCNEATLKQLPATGTKTLILAEPAAAKVIRNWKYFDREKVKTIPRWQHPRLHDGQSVVRIQVPPSFPGGEPGEVTVAFIQQKRDITGLHAAIGITYRPPPLRKATVKLGAGGLLTPPATPNSHQSNTNAVLQLPIPTPSGTNAKALRLAPPTPPSSPGAARRSLRSTRSMASLSPHARDRAVSVIFSPHGLSYRSLESYATSHLVSEAALPLTALLHCFHAVSNPWWLGGNISSGVPAGQETATALGARAWISTHDAEKDVRGLMTRRLKSRRYETSEIAEVLSPRPSPGASPVMRGKTAAGPSGEEGGESVAGGVWTPQQRNLRATEVLALKVGEEVGMTSAGIWREDAEEAVWERG